MQEGSVLAKACTFPTKKTFVPLHDSLQTPRFPSFPSRDHRNQFCDAFLSIPVGQGALESITPPPLTS